MRIGDIELKLKSGCSYCTPNLVELKEAIETFSQGKLPKDVKLTIELNSDWIGERVWHLNKVTVDERKFDGENE